MRERSPIRRGTQASRALSLVSALCLGCLIAGCHWTRGGADTSWVAEDLRLRTGHGTVSPSHPDERRVPSWICLDDGLTEEEAILLALLNNPTFQEQLVDLRLAWADIVQAAQIPNPDAAILFPVGSKQLEAAVEFPLEWLWLRPHRLAVARRAAARTHQTVLQAGLDLIRDVRVAHAQVLLAQRRRQIGEEAAQLQQRIADLAQTRFKEGDASRLEADTAHVESLRARQQAARLVHDVTLAQEHFRNLLGFSLADTRLRPAEEPVPELPEFALEVLIDEAIQNRPDILAAEEAIAAAWARRKLSKWDWLRVFGIVDSNQEGVDGPETGPGLRFTLPLFNWNQGAIARADAELDQAVRRKVVLRDRAAMELRQAYARYLQARQELSTVETRVRPALEETVRRAERAYREGNTSLLFVLENTHHLIQAATRVVQLKADLVAAKAELERSLGRSLGDPEPAHALLPPPSPPIERKPTP